jgi:hypothetical protein
MPRKRGYEALIAKAEKNGLAAVEDKPPMCLHILGQGLANKLHAEARKLWCAAAVVVLDQNVRRFLEQNDPKVLAQLLDALTGEEQ